jgi:hypothetical protein
MNESKPNLRDASKEELNKMSREEILQTLINTNQRQLVQMLVMTIGLAAELQPELLKEALSKVFDVSAIKDCTDRMMVLLAQCQDRAQRVAIEVEALSDAVNKDIQVIEHRLDRAALKMKQIA